MNEAASLFLLLVLLYLSDCFWWLPWNSCILESARPGGPWRWRVAASTFGNQRRCLVVLRPLPASVNLQLDPWPVTVSSSGLLAWSSAAWSPLGRPEQDGWARRWSDVERIEATGTALLVDGRAFHRFATAEAAREAAAWLETLRTAPPAQRQASIDRFWDRRWRTDDVHERLGQAMAAARPLRIAGAAQWAWMFVVVPAVAVLFGVGWPLLGLGLVLLALVITNVGLFVRGHRRLYPQRRGERLEAALIMAVSWPMAARAADVLARHAVADLDPLAVAAALEGLAGRQEFLSWVRRDAEHPLAYDELDELGVAIAGQHQDTILPRLRRLVDQAGLREDFPPCEQGAAAYCPRCRATYRRLEPSCAACVGVELRGLAATSSAATGETRWASSRAG